MDYEKISAFRKNTHTHPHILLNVKAFTSEKWKLGLYLNAYQINTSQQSVLH